MTAAVTVRHNGFAEMAFVGKKPWHGLGQELEAGADIDQWRVAAGMDWRIVRSRVRYGEGDNQKVFGDHHVLFRSDNKLPLSIVSPKYKIVQPSEVLEFFRDLTDANGYTLNTAGTLFDGKRFWALASIGEEACVVGEDKIGGFLLLSSSCDGTLATTARFTTVRVVCNNTLSMALKGAGLREYTIRHASKFDAETAKKNLGLARDSFGAFLKASRQLAAKGVDNEKAESFVASLLRDSGSVTSDDVTSSKQYQKIMDLFRNSAMGGTLMSAEGSAWGLVNAVTEFVDHHAKAKSDAHRMTSAWFGRGDDLKTSAMEKALAM